MSTGGTIEAMTPLKKKTQYYWVCQRPTCGHEWPAKDVNDEPKRCAKCKRLDWNRETKSVGRPPNDDKKDAKRGPKVKARKAARRKGK
jgi:hypothetical protein